MTHDLFAEMNNATLDLQSSQFQTFGRPLKRLAQLLKHPDLEVYNNHLTTGLDLDVFLLSSEKTGGSMVGSCHLTWPENAEQTLGLTLLLIEKLAADSNYAISFSHNYFYSGSNLASSIHSLTGQLIIPFVRDYKNYIQSRGSMQTTLRAPLSNKVFIVHGHDELAKVTIARFLEKVGLDAIILHEQANQGRTIIEKVIAHGEVGFAVILLTPDDEGCLKGGRPEPRARQNVLLELGYFIGRLGREKVCALKRGALEIPSDFAGMVWEQMDDAGGWKQVLARELEAAGHQIDWNSVMRA